MKKVCIFSTALILAFLIGCNEAKENQEGITLFPKGEKITNANFNGAAWLNMLATPDSINQMYAGLVTFEPGARTNWHSHPAGQILIVTHGEGFYQQEGKSKRVLRQGETVKCPPNIPHWHGASPESEFSHIAISSSDKGATQWLRPVSDKEYRSKLE
jgi:quercetin dioxygenase-like cupin family protein